MYQQQCDNFFPARRKMYHQQSDGNCSIRRRSPIRKIMRNRFDGHIRNREAQENKQHTRNRNISPSAAAAVNSFYRSNRELSPENEIPFHTMPYEQPSPPSIRLRPFGLPSIGDQLLNPSTSSKLQADQEMQNHSYNLQDVHKQQQQAHRGHLLPSPVISKQPHLTKNVRFQEMQQYKYNSQELQQRVHIGSRQEFQQQRVHLGNNREFQHQRTHLGSSQELQQQRVHLGNNQEFQQQGIHLGMAQRTQQQQEQPSHSRHLLPSPAISKSRPPVNLGSHGYLGMSSRQLSPINFREPPPLLSSSNATSTSNTSMYMYDSETVVADSKPIPIRNTYQPLTSPFATNKAVDIKSLPPSSNHDLVANPPTSHPVCIKSSKNCDLHSQTHEHRFKDFMDVLQMQCWLKPISNYGHGSNTMCIEIEIESYDKRFRQFFAGDFMPDENDAKESAFENACRELESRFPSELSVVVSQDTPTHQRSFMDLRSLLGLEFTCVRENKRESGIDYTAFKIQFSRGGSDTNTVYGEYSKDIKAAKENAYELATRQVRYIFSPELEVNFSKCESSIDDKHVVEEESTVDWKPPIKRLFNPLHSTASLAKKSASSNEFPPLVSKSTSQKNSFQNTVEYNRTYEYRFKEYIRVFHLEYALKKIPKFEGGHKIYAFEVTIQGQGGVYKQNTMGEYFRDEDMAKASTFKYAFEELTTRYGSLAGGEKFY